LDVLLTKEIILKASGMQVLSIPQSDEVAFEYIEKPMNNTDIMSNSTIIVRRYKKYSGTPGPINEN